MEEVGTRRARKPTRTSAIARGFAPVLALAFLVAGHVARPLRAHAQSNVPSPANDLRRKTAAAAAMKKGLELREAACQQLTKSMALDATRPDVVLRVSHCKRLKGELSRANTLAEQSLELTLSGPRAATRKAVNEPRAAAFARIGEEQWNAACDQLSQSLRGDATLEASMHVAACLIAATKLREARTLLTDVMPTLATQPQQAKRITPIMNAQLAEIARLQPYLTVAAPPEGLESLTVDDVAVLAGQPILVDPGAHTVVARTRQRTQTLQVALAPAERKTLSLAAEQDKLAENEFATGSQYLQSGCAALERAITRPDAGPVHLARLAWCRRLSAQHAEADALWKTILELASEKRTNAPAGRQADRQIERELRVADETLRQACARFQASLDLDADLATELAVTACQLRAGKLRLARARIERALAPPSPLAAAKLDALGRAQAQLARALLADLEKLQPLLRIEPGDGFHGSITVNGVEVVANTFLALDPGRYIVLQIPKRGPRVVHELTLVERQLVLLKRHLRCDADGKNCVGPPR